MHRTTLLEQLSALGLISLCLLASGCAGLGSRPQSSPAAIRCPESTRVPPEQVGPIDVRRTTLVVRDIDRSLALYRDALGLSVIYDRKIRTGEGRAGQPPIRLVLLRANDTFVGVLGLLQRVDQDAPPLQAPKRPQPGDVVVVINVKDLEARFAKVRAVPGVKVVEKPQRVAYPTPDGRSTIPVIFSAIYDPDGFFVELNRILGKPAGT